MRAMGSPRLFHSSVFISIAILVIAGSCNGEFSHCKERVPLFVFGDSLFDPGNNNYLSHNTQTARANFPPYGETFFRYPTGRFSDGRVVPDFIAEFAKLPLNRPYLQPGPHDFSYGTSFASAGASVLGTTTSSSVSISLRTQLSYFKNVVNAVRHELGYVEAEKFLSKAVYLFSIGGNDYFRYSQTVGNKPVITSEDRQFVGTVLGNLTEVLYEICQIGGRKIAFQNVGPIGCTPANRAQHHTGDCQHFPLMIASLHNSLLPSVHETLKKRFPGFKYAIFDYYSTLRSFSDHPEMHGFKEGKSACCGSGTYRGDNSCGGRGGHEYELCSNPSEYVWYDYAHTGDLCNLKLANLMWNGPSNVVKPYTVEQLFEHP